ncbi:MAG: HAMP domain-containing histidine kinase, partial [Planctomycetaceae bacterium]|nr:HAMP domain-containing histidine kinase [Planctomycetaceae bacterium]
DLTFNMLAWSRSASLETEQVQVGPIIQEAIDLLAVQCRHRKVTIHLEGDQDLPPVPVDASAFHQAILNLLTNAIEAVSAKTGRIVVRLQVDDSCDWVIISVEDNGDGIEPNRQAEVFQPFASSKGQRGTGLGLAVTRKIAEEHAGSLELDEAFTAGARFLLRLPLARDGD